MLRFYGVLGSDTARSLAAAAGRHRGVSSRWPVGAPTTPAVGRPAPDSPDPVRRVAFAMAVATVFLYFSRLHEIQASSLGANFYLLYVFGLPPLLIVVSTGAMRRVFRARPSVYWVGFALWITLAVPFSSWKGGSFQTLIGFFKAGMVMLLLIPGLTVTWRECKAVMSAIACASLVNLMSARLFAARQYGGERLGLSFGSIKDPNYFAAHLLLVLPFLLWVGLSSRSVVVRLGAFLGLGYGTYLVLGTGSRGGTVGLVMAATFFLFRSTTRQRIVSLLCAPLALVVLLLVIPQETWQRILTFSAAARVNIDPDSADDASAIGSTNAREYLLKRSIQYTFEHPLFGVGPGQFASYEGKHMRYFGVHGMWHETHNSYTQVASECGIPALLLFVAGIVSTFRLLSATHREARRRPDCEDIRTGVFCVMLGMTGFCTAATFLSLAYNCYLPALGGLAVSISLAAKAEFVLRDRGAPGPSGNS